MQIKLRNTDKIALIDDEDYHLIRGKNWRLSTNAGSDALPIYYVKCSIYHFGRVIELSLHRLVMGAKKGTYVDHINHDGLDCQKANLRFATQAQNNMNMRAGKNRLYKGITKRKYGFEAGIMKDGKTQYLGYFREAIDAAKAYDKRAREIFGEFACLNFPEVIL